jgi:hypothetical protein
MQWWTHLPVGILQLCFSRMFIFLDDSHATAWARRLSNHARTVRLLREWRVLLVRRNELREQIDAVLSNRKAAASSNGRHVRHLQAMLARSYWDSRRRLQRQFLAEISSFATHICNRLHALQDGMARPKVSSAAGTWSILSVRPAEVGHLQSFATRVLQATADKHGGIAALRGHFQHVCIVGAKDERQLTERLHRRIAVVEGREDPSCPEIPTSQTDSPARPLPPSQPPTRQFPQSLASNPPSSTAASTSCLRTRTLEEQTFALGLVKRARHAIRAWKRVAHLTKQFRLARESHERVVQR